MPDWCGRFYKCRMETKHYVSALWPGLAELWWRGRLSALPAALGFAIALNLWLVLRFIFPAWVPVGLVSMAFWVGAATWVFFVIRTLRELPALITPRQASEEPDRFSEAHVAFLSGDWSTAEDLLTDVLAIEPRDPPALLMLTSVYRHTDRLQAAQLLLAEIGRLEAADRWWLEVAAETKRLDRALKALMETETPEESDDQDSGSKSTAKEKFAVGPIAADLTEPPEIAA